MTGLSVRPALTHKGRAGCVTGVSASIVARVFSPEQLDAAFPFTLLHAMPAPRTPSRAIGSAPIYSFGRPRQSAGVGYSVDHLCLTTFITPESSTLRATSPDWAGYPRLTRQQRHIQSFVDPRSRWI